MEALVTARTALLQALLCGPGYGLELIRRVTARSNGALRLSQGSVYPALRSLEGEGLVKRSEVLAFRRRGGRPPAVYQLTGEGVQVAQQERYLAAALFRVAAAV